MPDRSADYAIIGAGIIGLALADRLRACQPAARIIVLEKEVEVGMHASGRNSGVLHAGFYYTADSLKARFTVEGNRMLREFCQQHQLPINECGKLVVAQNEFELEQLSELERRGKRNGSVVELIDAAHAKELEPNVRTFKQALFSPMTATIDPLKVIATLKENLIKHGVEIWCGAPYLGHAEGVLETGRGSIAAKKIVNCAGLYADKIARDFGFGSRYSILPFKGLYLKYGGESAVLKRHVYPVPNLRNPFLGVHFTKTVDGVVKIGPTAIPAFWRENYDLYHNFRLSEFVGIVTQQARLFLRNSFGFRDLAFEEIRKYSRKYFIGLAAKMVQEIDPSKFTEFTKPGIRAQLLDRKKSQLVQDFVIEGDHRSVHVLNAVSPGLTCSFPFSQYIINNYLQS
ncbi:MAG: L-2-hydroxyglutarate oxidase [Bdellovibrionales bacterium]|nr:L-2-hydroxyglutarate oxidase [Bdellovibrionales bacterium]